MGRTIKLVRPLCPPEPKFEVTADGLEYLRSFGGALYVICVVGKMRHGKSYIAGLLVGDPDAFKIAGTTASCTRGIDVCVVPRSGGGHWVLLDVEGAESTDRSATYDAALMTIAMLLSSVVVYNLKSVGTRADVDCLMLLSKLMQHVVDKAGEGVVGMDGNFPALVWLLRDFHLQIVDAANRPCDATTYLEDVLLASKPGSTSTARDRSRALNDIKTTFQERMLLTLPRPVAGEEDFEFLHTRARPAFVEKTREVIIDIQRCVKPKVFQDVQVTGAALGALALQFVRTVDEEGVPEVATAWQRVCGEENARAWTVALSSYTQQWEAEELPVDNPATIHEAAFQHCLRLYSKMALGAGEDRMEALTASLEEQFRHWEEASHGAAKGKCQSRLQLELASVSKGVQEGRFSRNGGLAAYDAAVVAALATFRETAEARRFPSISGACVAVWMEQNSSRRAAIRQADESLNENERAADEERQKAAQEQLAHVREMELLQQQLERKERQMKEQQAAHEEGLARQRREAEECRRLQAEVNQRRMNEFNALMQRQQKEQAQELKQRMDEAKKAQDDHLDRMAKVMEQSRRQQEEAMLATRAAVDQARLAAERQQAQTQEAVRQAQQERKRKDNVLLGTVAGLTMGFFPTCAPLIGAITTAATAGEVQPQAIPIPAAPSGGATANQSTGRSSGTATGTTNSSAAPGATEAASSAWV